MGWLRNDGIVPFFRQSQRASGIVDNNVDAIILQRVNLPFRSDEAVGVDNFRLQFDDIDRGHGRRHTFYGDTRAEADDQHVSGIRSREDRESR